MGIQGAPARLGWGSLQGSKGQAQGGGSSQETQAGVALTCQRAGPACVQPCGSIPGAPACTVAPVTAVQSEGCRTAHSAGEGWWLTG